MTEEESAESHEEFDATLDLLRCAKKGDEDSLNELFTRYSHRVLDIVRIRLGRSLRESLESQDILQATLEEAFRSFDRFEMREDAHFVNWLAKIAEHQIAHQAEYWRAQKRDRRGELSMDARVQDSEDQALERRMPASGPSPSVDLIRKEEQQAVADCISELPERYRTVIAMRDYVGASWELVARETDHATPGAARMTHNRARVALGKLLRERGLV